MLLQPEKLKAVSLSQLLTEKVYLFRKFIKKGENLKTAINRFLWVKEDEKYLADI